MSAASEAQRYEREAGAWGKVALAYIKKGWEAQAFNAAKIAASRGIEALGLRNGTIQ